PAGNGGSSATNSTCAKPAAAPAIRLRTNKSTTILLPATRTNPAPPVASMCSAQPAVRPGLVPPVQAGQWFRQGPPPLLFVAIQVGYSKQADQVPIAVKPAGTRDSTEKMSPAGVPANK